MRATGRRSSISRSLLLLTIALSFMTIMTRPGSANAPLVPGLFLEYRVELREGGQLQEENFRLDVLEALDSSSLSLLADLDRMQSQLADATVVGDSLFFIGDTEWAARSYTLSDSSSSVQRSESVTLIRITSSRGRAWIGAELPFGGWLRYEEERRTRKISEFAGRRFEGEEAVSRELWTLVATGTKR